MMDERTSDAEMPFTDSPGLDNDARGLMDMRTRSERAPPPRPAGAAGSSDCCVVDEAGVTLMTVVGSAGTGSTLVVGVTISSVVSPCSIAMNSCACSSSDASSSAADATHATRRQATQTVPWVR